MKTICVYHSADLDGICSGAIMRRRFPNALMVPYDYGQPFPHELIEEGDKVYMADVSLPMEQMHEIAVKASSFTWIDHHVSAYNDYLVEEPGMLGLGKVEVVYDHGAKISACELCWRHFNPLDQDTPDFVLLLGAYDVWRQNGYFDWEDEVLPFQYWCRSEVSCLEDFKDSWLNEYGVSDVLGRVEKGRSVMKYIRKSDEKWAQANSFRATVLGRDAVCLNSTRFSSQAFESVNKDCDLMVCFAFTGNKWKFSFYTEKDDIDCSQIAKHFGGGGHRKAAGCVVDDPKMIL